MNKSIAKVLIIFTLSTALIAIVSTGFWLLNQPSDICLGDTSSKYDGRGEFTSIIYVGAGLCLIFSVVYLFSLPTRHHNFGHGNQRMYLAITCCGLQLLVLILFASVYALSQSTFRFGSLQGWINSPEKWMNIKQCLYQDSGICTRFEDKYGGDSEDEFLARHLTPIESGCCKPPMVCGFNFSSSTIWIKPENGSYSKNDCYKWENDSKKLCYDCEACKLGYSLELKKAWTISGVVVVIAWLIFVLTFTLPRLLVWDEDELA